MARSRGVVLGKAGPANLRSNIEERQSLAKAHAERLRPTFDSMKARRLSQRRMVAELNSIGVPAPMTEVRLVDDAGRDVALGQPGELIVRGPQLMQGYWQRPEESADVLKDGWLFTGDIAVMDAQGTLHIVDRKKVMILISGFNVYPNEIEEVLARHE